MSNQTFKKRPLPLQKKWFFNSKRSSDREKENLTTLSKFFAKNSWFFCSKSVNNFKHHYFFQNFCFALNFSSGHQKCSFENHGENCVRKVREFLLKVRRSLSSFFGFKKNMFFPKNISGLVECNFDNPAKILLLNVRRN